MIPSTVRPSRVAALVLAAGAVVAMAGCAAAPGAPARPSSSAAITACPSADQVAGLTATPFAVARDGGRCTYTADVDGDRRSVVVQHPATSALPGNATLTAVRDEVAPGASSTVRTAPGLDFPAFVTRSPNGTCTTWLYGADGVVTTVAASGSDDPCALGAAVAALTGAAPTGSTARPVVDVVVPRSALTAAETAALRSRISEATKAEVHVLTGTPRRATAAAVDPAASAVVFIGGGLERAPLTVARDASAAFSATSARAPRTRLLVVGPPASAGPGAALRAAARIAGASWIRSPGAVGDGRALGDAIVESLRTDVL